MNQVKRFFAMGISAAIGLALTVLAFSGIIDAYWGGMGSALTAVMLVRGVRVVLLQTNAEYREKMEVEVTDERNRFLRNCAWAWTGYLFILVAAAASIVFRVLGYNLVSVVAGVSVLLMALLYWASYLLLRRKY